MEKELFLKIRKQIDDELTITAENVRDKTLKSPILTSRYYNILINEKKILNDLEKKKNEIYGKTYHKYKYEFDYSLDTKKEIETYVLSDEVYLNIDAKCKEQKLIVDYFEEHIKIFNKISFAYNTYLGFLKLQQGEL